MKLFSILILVLALSACEVGDKYNGLIVIDGNGNKYTLKHNIFDTYFIREYPKQSNSGNSYSIEANSKLTGE